AKDPVSIKRTDARPRPVADVNKDVPPTPSGNPSAPPVDPAPTVEAAPAATTTRTPSASPVILSFAPTVAAEKAGRPSAGGAPDAAPPAAALLPSDALSEALASLDGPSPVLSTDAAAMTMPGGVAGLQAAEGVFVAMPLTPITGEVVSGTAAGPFVMGGWNGHLPVDLKGREAGVWAVLAGRERLDL